MTLHKSMRKAAVLMGITGVLMFTGGAWATITNDAVEVKCPASVTLGYGSAIDDLVLPPKIVGSSKPSEVCYARSKTLDDSTGLWGYAVTVKTQSTATITDAVGSSKNVVFEIAIGSGDVINGVTGDGTIKVEVSVSLKVVKGRLLAKHLEGYNATAANVDTIETFGQRIYNKADQSFDEKKIAIGASTGLAGGTSALWGAITLKYATADAITGNLTSAFSNTKPKALGTYAIMAVFAGGSNFLKDSILIRGGKGTKAAAGNATAFFGSADPGLVVKYADGEIDWVSQVPVEVQYNPTGVYTVPWPNVLTSYYGTRDTLINVTLTAKKLDDPTADYDGRGTPAVTSSPSSFNLTAADVGIFKIGFDFVGVASNKNVWKASSGEIVVTVNKRNLGDGWMNGEKITVDVVGSFTYTGMPAKPTMNQVVVSYDGIPLRKTSGSEDFDLYEDGGAADDGTDYQITYAQEDNEGDWNRTSAGTGYVFLQGKGNFKGIARGSFAIAKKAITFSVNTVYTKEYDGSVALDTNSLMEDGSANTGRFVTVRFNSLGGVWAPDGNDGKCSPNGALSGGSNSTACEFTADPLANVADYLITNAVLDNAAAGSGRTATVTVALVPTGDYGKNYTLTTATATRTGVTVSKLTPTKDNFTYTIPADNARFFTDTRQGISGTLAFKSPITNGTATVQLRYGYGDLSAAGASGGGLDEVFSASDQVFHVDTSIYEKGSSATSGDFEGDTTLAPKAAGTYGVYAKVSSGGPNVNSGYYFLGTYTINEPAEAVFDTDLSGDDLEVRQTNLFTLSVVARSPNAGTLSYKWYVTDENDVTTEVRESGKSVNSPTITIQASKQGSFTYYVTVTNTKTGVQIPTTVSSTPQPVSVIDPPTRLNGKLTVDNTLPWTYTGYGITPTGPDIVTLTQITVTDDVADTVALTEGTDFVLEYSNNVKVGTATARAQGIGDYAGTVTATFPIVAKEIDATDITGNWELTYTGSPAVVNVRPRSPMDGMGVITATYSGSSTVPTNAGVYDVEVTVAAGTNFKGTGTTPLFISTLTIERKVPALADFLLADGSAFAIPTGHKEGVTANFGIPAGIKLKGSGFGSISILYDGSDTVPTTKGSYPVMAYVESGDNYEAGEVRLGTYTIIGADEIAVLESNREVPKAGVTEVVTVTPVKVAAASFTAGPSPVKAGTAIKFFSAKSVKSGSLYIFDAAGNAVAKKSVNSGSGEIASWNLKDKKGVAVAEGTYVVKGALIGKDGTREKVSFVFSVVK